VILERPDGTKRSQSLLLFRRKDSKLAQDLDDHGRAYTRAVCQVESGAGWISVRDLERDPHPGRVGPQDVGKQANDLVALRTTLADDLSLAGSHQLLVELPVGTDHFRIGCHRRGDLAAGGGAGLRKLTRIA
jgi:hypothetical protein